MRYTLDTFDLTLIWPPDSAIDWTSWNPFPNVSIQIDHTTQDNQKFGGFRSDLVHGVVGPNSVNMMLKTSGIRRASLVKKTRELLRSAISHSTSKAHPYVDIEVSGEVSLKSSGQKGPVLDAVHAVLRVPWINEEEVVDLAGVKYYIRSKSSSALAKLELTPGLPKEDKVHFRLEVFKSHTDLDSIPDLETTLLRVLNMDIPRLLGGEVNSQ